MKYKMLDNSSEGQLSLIYGNPFCSIAPKSLPFASRSSEQEVAMRILLATAVLALASPASSAQNLVVNQSGTPKCSAIQHRNWELTTKDTLGIIGRDSTQTSLGSVPGNRILRKNWWPLQSTKIPICGKLHHFDWHSGDVFT